MTNFKENKYYIGTIVEDIHVLFKVTNVTDTRMNVEYVHIPLPPNRLLNLKKDIINEYYYIIRELGDAEVEWMKYD